MLIVTIHGIPESVSKADLGYISQTVVSTAHEVRQSFGFTARRVVVLFASDRPHPDRDEMVINVNGFYEPLTLGDGSEELEVGGGVGHEVARANDLLARRIPETFSSVLAVVDCDEPSEILCGVAVSCVKTTWHRWKRGR